MIRVCQLDKNFWVHLKEPGVLGSVRSLFRRKKKKIEALKKIDLQIGEGEIVGILGANGAGKTTLVKILAGIIHPSAGKVVALSHVPWKRDNQFRSQIALVMGQKAQLWWDLPALDCFLLLKQIYGIPDETYKKNLQELTETLEVADRMKIQIRRLSLGERMKMELIAVLLHDPKLLFLDEPTIGLDLTAQRAIRQFILEYQKTRKATVVLTSHYMEDVKAMCQRVVILREGALVYDGTLSKIQSNYSQHKILEVQLAEGLRESFSLPEGMGELSGESGGRIQILVVKEKVSQLANHLLNTYKVEDISIHEQPVGQIIELLQSGKN